jgi:hypothetical protein
MVNRRLRCKLKTIAGKIFVLLFSSLLVVACTSQAPVPAPIPANPVLETTPISGNPIAAAGASQDLPTQNPINADLIDYTHKNLIFRLKIPINWKVDEQEYFTDITAPDESGSIQVFAVNTGIELNELGFANFVDATEKNNFAGNTNYSLVERIVDNKKWVATLRSTFDTNKIPQKLLSIYQREDSVIFYIHLESNASSYEKNNLLFEQIIRSSFFNSASAAGFNPYNIVYDFTGSKNLFVIEIPTNWTYKKDNINNGIQDKFISPDGHGRIENITYDDGNAITRGKADRIALELLKEIYAKDVRISEAKTQPDLSIRWSWNSTKNGIEGTTFYETRGTSFLMLTFFWDKDYSGIFNPLFNRLIETYHPFEG